MPASRPKKKFQRYDPDQTLLIAPDLHEWLPEDHLVYFVSDIVDDLDLADDLGQLAWRPYPKFNDRSQG